jgi:hypothetical protein
MIFFPEQNLIADIAYFDLSAEKTEIGMRKKQQTKAKNTFIKANGCK